MRCLRNTLSEYVHRISSFSAQKTDFLAKQQDRCKSITRITDVCIGYNLKQEVVMVHPVLVRIIIFFTTRRSNIHQCNVWRIRIARKRMRLITVKMAIILMPILTIRNLEKHRILVIVGSKVKVSNLFFLQIGGIIMHKVIILQPLEIIKILSGHFGKIQRLGKRNVSNKIKLNETCDSRLQR